MKIFKITSVIVLCVILIFSTVRLYGNIQRFGRAGLQIDFSVYYTAGQSLINGAPLYKNGITLQPPIWDGAAIYSHSRFIYPPLSAIPFGLIAATMTYLQAKFFWIYFSLACLLASIFITVRILKLKLALWHYLAIGLYTTLFFPLTTFIALGQIDALTLLLALVAIALTVKREPREIASGIFWAFATLFKLHIGLVIFFFILRKQWKLLAGYFIGGAIISILTIMSVGPTVFKDYLIKDLPRMVHYGENGPPEARLPKSDITNYYKEYGQGHTKGLIKDDIWFPGSHISFAPNASLARFIMMRAQDINKNWQIPPSLISVILTAILLPLAYWGLRKLKTKVIAFSSEQEFLYWYAVLMFLLLLGPLSWTMNVIWVLPLVALAVVRHPWSTDKMSLAPWILLVTALILAFVPDCMYLGWRNFESPSWGCKMLDSSKNIWAEILIIASVWLQIGGSLLLNAIHSRNKAPNNE